MRNYGIQHDLSHKKFGARVIPRSFFFILHKKLKIIDTFLDGSGADVLLSKRIGYKKYVEVFLWFLKILRKTAL